MFNAIDVIKLVLRGQHRFRVEGHTIEAAGNEAGIIQEWYDTLGEAIQFCQKCVRDKSFIDYYQVCLYLEDELIYVFREDGFVVC